MGKTKIKDYIFRPLGTIDIEDIQIEIKQKVESLLKTSPIVDYCHIDDVITQSSIGYQISMYHMQTNNLWAICEVYLYYENNAFDYIVYNIKGIPKEFQKVVRQVCKLIEKILSKYCKKEHYV